jgi:hypothetical protein
MRLNIEIIAPWLTHKRGPLKKWFFHYHHNQKGIIQGKPYWFVRVAGINITLTRDALWNGIGVSINF